jgi:ribonucleoside-diphosphate reductase alpha chain
MSKEDSLYETLSAERKQLQDEDKLPSWFTTGGWQLFKEKVMFESDGYNSQVNRIAKHLSEYAPSFPDKDNHYGKLLRENYGNNWEEVFTNIFKKGDLAPSSPLIANGGTDRGCTVSCSGGLVDDSISGFYKSIHETAMLTKEGFGTSAYLGDIRPRGADFTGGGKASGSYPVLKSFVQLAKDVSQGSVRRGAWAGYLEIDHGDFDEWADMLHKNPESMNIGWVVSDKVIQAWKDGDAEMVRRFKKALWIKCQSGKGYFWKVDHVNRQQPQMYKDLGLSNKASNLCTEITLHADEEHTYTCVLSSMNGYRYDEWVDTGGVFAATVLLDCNAQSFIERAKNIEGLEKAVRFTEKSRALGLGLLGFHSYLQKNMVAMDSFEAHMINNRMFKHMHDESLEASKWMAREWGEPEWGKGYGVRNTHRMAIAPNMSSAVMAGQVSQGIEPIIANVYTQATTAGEMQRINPEFLKIAKERGKYNKKTIRSIIDRLGSVQHLQWLSEDEKNVFKTAFEIDQRILLRLASTRQQWIDQGQSLNLFFSADEDESYIADVHREFFEDERLKGLYYLRTMAGVDAAKDSTCEACEG